METVKYRDANGQFQNLLLGTDNIANNAVTSVKIPDASIVTAKLANTNVTYNKLAADVTKYLTYELKMNTLKPVSEFFAPQTCSYIQMGHLVMVTLSGYATSDLTEWGTYTIITGAPRQATGTYGTINIQGGGSSSNLTGSEDKIHIMNKGVGIPQGQWFFGTVTYFTDEI